MVKDLIRTVAPADLLTLEAAKAQVRVDFDDDDRVIAEKAASATAALDGYAGALGRALITQTWVYYLECMPGRCVQLPLPPLQRVCHVKYLDGNGVRQTVDSASYTVQDGPVSRIKLNSGYAWPSAAVNARAWAITFVCGYGDDPEDVPADIVDCAKLLLTDSYENRSGSDESTDSVKALVRRYGGGRI